MEAQPKPSASPDLTVSAKNGSFAGDSRQEVVKEDAEDLSPTETVASAAPEPETGANNITSAPRGRADGDATPPPSLIALMLLLPGVSVMDIVESLYSEGKRGTVSKFFGFRICSLSPFFPHCPRIDAGGLALPESSTAETA